MNKWLTNYGKTGLVVTLVAVVAIFLAGQTSSVVSKRRRRRTA